MCPTSPEHSEDREDSRRRNFGWHSVFSKGVGLIWRRTLRPRGLFFPSEKLTTPLSLDNLWRRYMLPKLEDAGLEWPTFQVLRKTNASLSKKAGVDPKVVSDQRGHGLGVSLEIYTSLRHGTKASSRQETRSRCASKTATRKRVSAN
jgi:hypothetical protein